MIDIHERLANYPEHISTANATVNTIFLSSTAHIAGFIFSKRQKWQNNESTQILPDYRTAMHVQCANMIEHVPHYDGLFIFH